MTGPRIHEDLIHDALRLKSVEAMRLLFAEFEDFAEVVWNVAIPGGASLTPRQREMARYFQHGPERKFLGAFRGAGKSYLGATYADWCYLQDPTEQVLVLSGNPKKASDFSNWSRGLIEHPQLPMLHHLKPRKGQRDSLLSWDVNGSPLAQSSSFTAFSVGAGIQGQRASKIIPDDCEMKVNSGTEFLRQKLLRSVVDISTMTIPDRRSEICVLGTFQSAVSIYRTLIEERGFDAMLVPARVPSNPSEYGGHLSPDIAAMAKDPSLHGKPSDTRFSHEYLLREEMALGPVQFKLEFMLSTEFGDRMAHPFPLEKLVVWDAVNPFGAPTVIVPGAGVTHRIDDLNFCGLAGDAFYKPAVVHEKDMIPYGIKAIYIDPAGNSGKDEAAFSVLGAVPGRLYLLDNGGYLNGVDPKTLKLLVHKAKEWGVNRVVYEDNMPGWGPLFEQMMATEGFSAEVKPIRSTTNKALRIVGELEPVIYGGQLVVSRGILEREWQEAARSRGHSWQEYLLQFQLAMFRRGEKGGGLRVDDRVDSLAIGVSDLKEEYLKTNTAAAARNYAEMAEEEDFLLWQDGVFGESRGPARWVDA